MIRFPIKTKPRKLKGALIGPGSGPAERIKQLQIWVTALVRNERIEGREDRMRETRQYAEQLINLAIANGDKHKPTMEMADKWLLEKDLVHKLFKVLVPRYSQNTTAFTSVFPLPANYPGNGHFNCVLELKGNPYPPVIPHQRDNSQLLSNTLISAAARDFYSSKGLRETNFISDSAQSSMDFEHVDKQMQVEASSDADDVNGIGDMVKDIQIDDLEQKTVEKEIPKS